MATSKVLSQATKDIGRGHAEILMGMIADCLPSADADYNHITKIGVTVGPGSFTGVRVGMSVARGLALSLDVPAIGISTLDACEARAKELGCIGPLVSLLDAKRGELYCKLPGGKAFAGSCEDVSAMIHAANNQGSLALCGAGVELFDTFNLPVIHKEAAPDIAVVAKLAAQADETKFPPEPLYLRSADAKVQAGFALERSETASEVSD